MGRDCRYVAAHCHVPPPPPREVGQPLAHSVCEQCVFRTPSLLKREVVAGLTKQCVSKYALMCVGPKADWPFHTRLCYPQ